MGGAYSANPGRDGIPSQPQQPSPNDARLRDSHTMPIGVNSNVMVDWYNNRGGMVPSQQQQQQQNDARLRNRSPTTSSTVSMEQAVLEALNRAGLQQTVPSSQPVGGQRQPSMDELNSFLARANNLNDQNALSQIQLQLTEAIRFQQQAQQQQTAVAAAQQSSRTRSPAHLSLQQAQQQQQAAATAQQSSSRPSSRSLTGRPGSATSQQSQSHRASSSGMKYPTNQQHLSALSDQLQQAYPHRPTSASIRSYPQQAPQQHMQSVVTQNQLQQAYVNNAYSENLQDLLPADSREFAAQFQQIYSQILAGLTQNVRSQSAHNPSAIPPKRARLVSVSQSQKSYPQSSSSSQQQQRQQTPNEQQQQQAQQKQQQVAAVAVAAASNLLGRQSTAQLLQNVDPTTINAFLAANQAAYCGSSGRSSSFSSDAAAAAAVAAFNQQQQQHAQQHRNMNASQHQRTTANVSQLLVSSPSSLSQFGLSNYGPGFGSGVTSIPSSGGTSVHSSGQPRQQQTSHVGRNQTTSATHYPRVSYGGVGGRGVQQAPQSSFTSSGAYLSHSSSASSVTPQGSGVLRQQTKEPAYHPQVEAISPAPEEARIADAQDMKLQREREEIQAQLSSIMKKLTKEEEVLRHLSDTELRLTVGLQTEVGGRQPGGNRRKSLGTVVADERAYENPIQVLISESRIRARQPHYNFERLCGPLVKPGPCALPFYRQPSDLQSLRQLQLTYRHGFRRKLIRYIHRRKQAEKARLRFLAKQYASNAQIFFKKHEKLMNSAKRRQKDAKHREIFEKMFPEVKKIREDQEKGEKDGVKSDAPDTHGDAVSNTGSNTTENDQGPLCDPIEELNKMKEYAIDPPVPLAPWEKAYQFVCTTHLVTNPKSEHVRAQALDKWSEHEKTMFKERFLATPKNFTSIASYLEKSVSECIHYYYLSKKKEGYKQLVKKNTSASRRRRAGHTDKNGPTGTSHGRVSIAHTTTPAPSSQNNTPAPVDGRAATVNLDAKHEDGHPPPKKSGNSTRGRAGRHRDTPHRNTKSGTHKNVSARSNNPQQQSSLVPEGTSGINDVAMGVNNETTTTDDDDQPTNADAKHEASKEPSSKKEDSSTHQSSNEYHTDSEKASSTRPPSTSGGVKPYDSPSTSSASIQDLIQITIENNYANVQSKAAEMSAKLPQRSGPVAAGTDSRRFYNTASSATGAATSLSSQMPLEIINLTHSSPGINTFSSQTSHNTTANAADDSDMTSLKQRGGFLSTGGQSANGFNQSMPFSQETLAALLPGLMQSEQMAKAAAALTTGGCLTEVGLQQLATVFAASRQQTGSGVSSQSQSQMLAQFLACVTQSPNDLLTALSRWGSLSNAGPGNMDQTALLLAFQQRAMSMAQQQQSGSRCPTSKQQMEPMGHGSGGGSIHLSKTAGEKLSIPADTSSTASAQLTSATSSTSVGSDFNKAILIGDFCTAQQLGRSGGTSIGLSQRSTADYNDPAYLHARALDPATLPIPSSSSSAKRSARSIAVTSGIKVPPHQSSHPSSISSSMGDFRHQTGSPSNLQQQLQHREGNLFRGLESVMARQAENLGTGFNPQSGLPTYYALSPSPPKDDVHGERISSNGSVGGRRGNYDDESSVSAVVAAAESAKLKEYMREATRLYHEEVEPYTFRDRSDSMRTRTSSEASQMYAAACNVRQRADGGHFGPLPGFKPPHLSLADTASPNTPSSIAASSPTVELIGSELLAKYGSKFMASATQPAFPFIPGENEAVLRRHGGSMDINRSSTCSASANAHHSFSDQIFSVGQHHVPPPRYRKQTQIIVPPPTSTTSSASSPTIPVTAASAEEFSSSPSIIQTLVRNQQQPIKKIVESGGEGMRGKPSPRQQNYRVSSPASGEGGDPRLILRNAVTDVGACNEHLSHASLLMHNNEGKGDVVFRQPEPAGGPTTSISLGSTSGNSNIGTLGDQIEKAIAEGITKRATGKSIPSKVESKSSKSIRPNITLITDTREDQGTSPLLPRSFTGNQHAVFPKKRNRLNSGFVSSSPPPPHINASPKLQIGSEQTSEHPTKQLILDNISSQSLPTSGHQPPNRSNLIKAPQQSGVHSEGAGDEAPIAMGGRTPKTVIVSDRTSPESSVGSPGNLQICLPNEDDLLLSPQTDSRQSSGTVEKHTASPKVRHQPHSPAASPVRSISSSKSTDGISPTTIPTTSFKSS